MKFELVVVYEKNRSSELTFVQSCSSNKFMNIVTLK